MASVIFEQVTKQYDSGLTAVKDLNLTIEPGEFLVLVGPSGCGKTTSLRLLAGLEHISQGTIYIDDVPINDTPPKDRNIAMVFQSYALYPHMSVFANMSFSLELQGLPRRDIRQRVLAAAEQLGIATLLDRKPKELSGGQRQRVAVGRAIVRHPTVFLMDEPLSNLDAKLRVQARAELSQLHQRLGTTFVYVTHDQVEAMTMGSRIAVMHQGILQQVDTPQTLYAQPANVFVAGFMGSPAMNFLPARLKADGPELAIATNSFTVPVPRDRQAAYQPYQGQEVILGIRPEHLCLPHLVREQVDQPLAIGVQVQRLEPMGHETIAYATLPDGQDIVARLDPRSSLQPGEEITLWLDRQQFHLFDRASEQRL